MLTYLNKLLTCSIVVFASAMGAAVTVSAQEMKSVEVRHADGVPRSWFTLGDKVALHFKESFRPNRVQVLVGTRNLGSFSPINQVGAQDVEFVLDPKQDVAEGLAGQAFQRDEKSRITIICNNTAYSASTEAYFDIPRVDSVALADSSAAATPIAQPGATLELTVSPEGATQWFRSHFKPLSLLLDGNPIEGLNFQLAPARPASAFRITLPNFTIADAPNGASNSIWKALLSKGDTPVTIGIGSASERYIPTSANMIFAQVDRGQSEFTVDGTSVAFKLKVKNAPAIRKYLATNPAVVLRAAGKQFSHLSIDSGEADPGIVSVTLRRSNDNKQDWDDAFGQNAFEAINGTGTQHPKFDLGTPSASLIAGQVYSLNRHITSWINWVLPLALVWLILWALVTFTPALRDVGAPRTDGRPATISLARVQMTGWSVLVAWGYLYLWYTLAEPPKITTELIALMGIGAVTAVVGKVLDTYSTSSKRFAGVDAAEILRRLEAMVGIGDGDRKWSRWTNGFALPGEFDVEGTKASLESSAAAISDPMAERAKNYVSKLEALETYVGRAASPLDLIDGRVNINDELALPARDLVASRLLGRQDNIPPNVSLESTQKFDKSCTDMDILVRRALIRALWADLTERTKKLLAAPDANGGAEALLNLNTSLLALRSEIQKDIVALRGVESSSQKSIFGSVLHFLGSILTFPFNKGHREKLPRLQARLEELNALEDVQASEGIIRDIITDDRGFSFSRLQFLFWTLVFMGLFWSSVLHHLTFPSIDSFALTLMGLSAGTYMGFKIPQAKPSP